MSFFSAVDLRTGDLVLPSSLSKSQALYRAFVCPECRSKVIFRNGPIRRKHFAHFKLHSKCSRYTNPGESTIHKEAKWLLKQYLESHSPFKIGSHYTCGCFSITTVPPFESVVTEHKVKENQRIDVASLGANGDLVCSIEVVHTHKTLTSRPEPW